MRVFFCVILVLLEVIIQSTILLQVCEQFVVKNFLVQFNVSFCLKMAYIDHLTIAYLLILNLVILIVDIP